LTLLHRWALVAISVTAGPLLAFPQQTKVPPDPPPVIQDGPEPLGLTLASGLVKDGETGRVLWSKDPGATRYPASTTKMMTALILLERTRPEEIVTVTKEAASTGGSGIGLKAGDKCRMEDLIKAIVVKSANDACIAAAIHSAGSVKAFVTWMNQKAKDLGAVSTRFANPHGLHDPTHVTTAEDLSIIGKAAMTDPVYRALAATPKIWVAPLNKTPKEFSSTNTLLEEDPTVKGIKTGWTNPAGRCFVGWHEAGSMNILTVALGCRRWQDDQRALMQWVWNTFEKAVLCKKGEPVAEVEVKGALGGKVALLAEQTLEGIVRRGRPSPKIVLQEGLSAPLAPGQTLGYADFGEGFKVNLTTDKYTGSRLQAAAGIAAGTAMLGGAFFAHRNRNAQRNRRSYRR
jgi:serine-type D-Ala-D-Ala carboxypeptidase (penicillin-binding protein 5/6)